MYIGHVTTNNFNKEQKKVGHYHELTAYQLTMQLKAKYKPKIIFFFFNKIRTNFTSLYVK